LATIRRREGLSALGPDERSARVRKTAMEEKKILQVGGQERREKKSTNTDAGET